MGVPQYTTPQITLTFDLAAYQAAENWSTYADRMVEEAE